jgi:two-component system, NtrC family, sensor histidine kinase PilS
MSGSPAARAVGALAVRLGVIGAVFALAVVLELRRPTPYSDRQLSALYALVLAGFLLTLAQAALAAYGGGKREQRGIELGLDGILVSALVYCTGGESSLFAFLYHVCVVHAAVRFGSRGAWLACAASLCSYAAIAGLPAFGWLTPFDPRASRSLEIAAIGIATHAVGLLLVAVLANVLAREVVRGREELHDLGELHRRIVDNVASGLLSVDASGKILSFNAEAERITGYAASELLGQPLERLFSSEGQIVPEALDGRGGGAVREQLRFRNRAGENLHLGFSSSALRNSRGEVDGAVLIFQDLTRVVEMQAQLRRSERLSAVGQLATGLAHEVRNPLGAISGAIELLSADFPTDASSLRLFRIVKRETERLNRLVSDFLRFARSAPGRREPVALRPLLDEMARLITEDPRQTVALVVDVADDVAVAGDPDQLRQVFWNLISNAAEAAPSDGQVHIQAAPERDAPDSRIEVVVSDRGCGIEPEALEHVFEPFFTTKPQGTGLGLATVHRLVESGGGSVSVRSESAKGTQVRLVLPRART